MANKNALTFARGEGIASGRQNRKMIKWNLPNIGLVEMYINPQSLSITEKKIIKETRTKGGYLIQYWGEQLPEMKLSGHTGSGGIEGINVLQSIYRQEQIGFSKLIKDLNVDFFTKATNTATSALKIFGINIGGDNETSAVSAPIDASSINSLSQVLTGQKAAAQDKAGISATIKNIGTLATDPTAFLVSDPSFLPTLATLATSVEMWYDGIIYRGYFKDFMVDEKADQMGIFNYSMTFTITRKTGERRNGFAWQRSVEYGPADADVIPLSFNGLINHIPAPPRAPKAQTDLAFNGTPFSGQFVQKTNSDSPLINTSRRGSITNRVK